MGSVMGWVGETKHVSREAAKAAKHFVGGLYFFAFFAASRDKKPALSYLF